MKIAYYTWQTCVSGGMERVTVNKINYWARAGHEVYVITREQRGRKPFYPIDSRVKQIDLDIDYQDLFSISNPIVRRRQLSKRADLHRQKLDDVLNEISVDIFVCAVFWHEEMIIAQLTDRSKKVLESHTQKYALLPQESQAKGIMGRIQNWLIRRRNKQVYSRLPSVFDRFVVLTNEDRELWRELDKIEVIPNASSFAPPTIPASLKTKRVIAVGRLAYPKNFSDLIKIWERVSPRFPDWRLDIYGDGEERQMLEREIVKSGVSDTLTIFPATSRIQEEYLSSSILTMTSRYEGFGMVLIEAQTCGIPIVSYACPCGPRDVITDGENGFLVPPGDRDLFVERLCQLMSDQELRQKMGRAAYTNVERFAEEHVMEQWRELFDRLLHS